MKSLWKFLLVAVLLQLGCDKSTDPDSASIPAALVGTWTATEFIFTSKTAMAQTTGNLISLGVSFTLKIESNGNFTVTTTFPTPQGPMSEVSTGTLSVSGNKITVKDEEGTFELTYSVSGNILTITGDEEYDFDGDDVDEPATMRIVLQKS